MDWTPYGVAAAVSGLLLAAHKLNQEKYERYALVIFVLLLAGALSTGVLFFTLSVARSDIAVAFLQLASPVPPEALKVMSSVLEGYITPNRSVSIGLSWAFMVHALLCWWTMKPDKSPDLP
ncbi:hypothetical protein [Achromobacter ruhlandii]|uniref:hypothetical protein n=1 Tax=Achromobacter ruhlandii TaxID=72557 RepID=UPI0012E7E35A|nr:hypothetical protein [Achromobacter ruhlandii]